MERNLLRMKEEVRSMKRENSFPWQVNPDRGHQKNQKNDVAELGLTELGDIVGQTTETCPRD